MPRILSQRQARGILRTLESLVTIGGWVDEIFLAKESIKFTCYRCGGYGVSLHGKTTEVFDDLKEFADFYNLTWM